MVWRQLAAILALPVVVVGAIPSVLAFAAAGADTRWQAGPVGNAVLHGCGAVLWTAGLLLSGRCVWLFARVGRGTLAPWDPTQRLVVEGPYRYVRNPMISGVVAMLLGEALGAGSLFLLAWALGFWCVNHVYFLVSEEPGLLRRFGADYERYRAHVPRWLPRCSAWRAAPPSDGDPA